MSDQWVMRKPHKGMALYAILFYNACSLIRSLMEGLEVFLPTRHSYSPFYLMDLSLSRVFHLIHNKIIDQIKMWGQHGHTNPSHVSQAHAREPCQAITKPTEFIARKYARPLICVAQSMKNHAFVKVTFIIHDFQNVSVDQSIFFEMRYEICQDIRSLRVLKLSQTHVKLLQIKRYLNSIWVTCT